MREDAERLAEMARNRGLKLLRSRVRTAGKPGFGMFGLADSEGEPVFGLRGKRALRASAAEIEDYLRGLESSDWKKSLKASGARLKKAAPAKAAKPEKPAPPPPPQIREAKGKDADQIAALFALLDHQVTPEQVRGNLKAMAKVGDIVLVAATKDAVLAACAVHRTVHPHRKQPVGRISILVVAESLRGTGIGRTLVAGAERRLASLGCGLLEITSNDRLKAAHAFYEHLGYERTSLRFAKKLGSG